MNKTLILVVIGAGFAVLFGVGRVWKLKPENELNRQLHSGDTAVLAARQGDTVWLALNKDDTEAAQLAMDRQDKAMLKAWEEAQRAFAVASGTFVTVRGESVSRLQVEVLDGPQAGKKGWAEFELVRTPRAGEHR